VSTNPHFRALLLFFLVSLTALAHAQTVIRVPADQPSIQAGIDAAQIGDTVLVAPGTYFEMIDFKGKAITVTSSAGPASTIIDGSHLRDFIVKFVHTEKRDSVINGFTITNSCADSWPVDSFSECGGILVGATNINLGLAADPTIVNNRIHHNHGFGIRALFAGGLIKGNTVSYTTTQFDPRYDFGCDYNDGTGIAIYGGTRGIFAEITGNIVEHNTGPADGGGVYITGPVTTISNNVVRYNQAECYGGGIYIDAGGRVPIVQNLVYGNVARVFGGGMFVNNPNANSVQVFIVNNTVAFNTINPNRALGRTLYDGSQIVTDRYARAVPE
jgi:parallel beta-helix repeat protein